MTKNAAPLWVSQEPGNPNGLPEDLLFAGGSAEKEGREALTRPVIAWIAGETLATEMLFSAARASKDERDMGSLENAWKRLQETLAVGVEQGFLNDELAKKEEEKKAFFALVNAVVGGWGEAIAFLAPLADAKKGRSNSGKTILGVAAKAVSAPGGTLDLLLPWADAKAQDKEGRSALMIAAEAGNLVAIERLLPLSDVAAVDQYGRDALMHTVAGRPGENQEEAARRLATVSDLGLRDDHGASALRLAASSGAKKALAALIPLQGLDAAGAPLPELAVAAERAAGVSHEAKMLFLPWLALPAFERALREMVYMAVGLNDGEKTLAALAPLAKGMKRASRGEPDKHSATFPNADTALDLAFWMALSRKKWPKADVLAMNSPLNLFRLAIRTGYLNAENPASLLPMSFARLENETLREAMQAAHATPRESVARGESQESAMAEEKKTASRRRL